MAQGSGRVPVLVWPVFFVSGAAGLMYQVIWMRHAALHLGGAHIAVGTVVATFLGGLALGARGGGRWMDRALAGRPAAFAASTFAVLELGIAGWGLLFEPLLAALTPLAGALYGPSGDNGTLFNAARVLLCAALILPPTAAMGASLPILARFAATWADDPARATGRLYAVNTFGAVAGALTAGLVTLPQLGLFGSTLVAVGLNVGVAAGALAIARTRAPPVATGSEGSAEVPKWILRAYAVSGFAALACEVAWTRGLVLSFGSSVYAFSLTLASFILGIALGSAIAVRAGPAVRNVAGVFAGLQIVTAVCAAATVPLLQQQPLWMMELAARGPSPGQVLGAQAALAALTLLPATIAIGAMFPVLLRAAMGPREHAGAAVGRLYAWNTSGSILGTLAATFVLLPWIGVRGCILVAAALNLGVAAVALHQAGWGMRAVAPLLITPALLLVPRFDDALVSSQPLLYGKMLVRRGQATGVPLAQLVRTQAEVVFSRWDAGGLVTVHRSRLPGGGDQLTLRVNGKSDASNAEDMATQVLTSHVPLLLHPDPQDVLVVGLGSGATLSAALTHPVQAVDCIEISPAVVEASALFGPLLDEPLSDPRVTLHVNDARAHLRFSSRRYDVIASEPSNLWIRGMASLFTVEHFARLRARLKPGGIVAQWVHAYHLPADDFAAVLASFHDVFPDSALWEVGVERDYFLVGFTGDLPSWATPAARYRRAAVRRALDRWGAPSLAAVFRGWILGAEGIAAYAGDVQRVTDDHTWVEYTAPSGVVSPNRTRLLDRLQIARTVLGPTLEGGPSLHRFRLGRALLAGAFLSDVADNLFHQLVRLEEARPHAGDDLAFRTSADELGRQVRVGVPGLVADGHLAHALRLLELVPPGSAHRSWAEREAAALRARAP